MQLASRPEIPISECRRRFTRRWSIRCSRILADVRGRALCCRRRGHDGVMKTGNVWLWPCVALLVVIGTVRAFEMRNITQRRNSDLTFEQAARWEARYQIGAMLYAAALGLWCVVTLLGSNDAVAHMICDLRDDRLHRRRRRPHLRPPVDLPVQILLACGPMSLALALHGSLYYIGLAVLIVLFFIGLKHIQPACMHLREGADRERPRSGAGRPVRHRAEQHAARPVHVRAPTGGLRS